MNAADTIKAVAERFGWEYRPDYSGRGMFGTTCPAVVCPRDQIYTARNAVRQAGVNAEPSMDSMGLDTVIYWPFVPFEDEAEADRSPETALTRRELERARELASQVYDLAFSLIDWEHDFDGPDAGFIATAVEKAFMEAYERRLNGNFELA